MDDEVFRIKEFNIQNIEPSSSWIILGPPGSGKSTFVEELIKYNKHKYPVCRVVCSVPGPNQRYCSIFPSIFVHSTFDKAKESEFIEKRQKVLANNQDIGKFCVYVLDDIDIHKKQFSDPFFAALFKQGSRHWCMLTIMVNQYALEFPPEVRSASSYVVIFRYTSNTDRNKIYNNYGGSAIFKNEKIFNFMMDNLTGNHNCMILKQRSDSNELSDSLFYYRTSAPVPWKFGSNEIWQWNKKRCSKKKKYMFV
jgi:Ni2+-binding GTPase involved in regulation of expression and maturation of urease and hydrogenase